MALKIVKPSAGGDRGASVMLSRPRPITAMNDPLQQLHARYRHSLRNRQRLLEDLWRKTASDVEALTQVHHAVHRLAGSAPLYGYAVIGDHARAVDHAIEALGGTMDEAQRLQIDLVLHSLLAELEAAATGVESAVVVSTQPDPAQVLLIDDQPERARRLASALRRHGCGVRVAEDSTDVWQQLVTWSCTAVVIDLALQVVEPAQLLGLIRGEARFANLRIVAIGSGQKGGCAGHCDVILGAGADSAAVHAALLGPNQAA